MADNAPTTASLDDPPFDVAMQQTPWRKEWRLSSMCDRLEAFLLTAGFDRGPWLAVAFAGGIALWFLLSGPFEWIAAGMAGLLIASAAWMAWRNRDERAHLRTACIAGGLLLAAGIAGVWTRSEIAGAAPIEGPIVAAIDARVLERIEQPAQGRVRLVLATRAPRDRRAIKVRVNLPLAADDSRIDEGAVIRVKARLMPPAAPLLPGSYDFARAAWFQGLSATGSVLGAVEVLEPAQPSGGLAELQRALSAHVRERIDGSPGAIAAAFASGDRGALPRGTSRRCAIPA